MPSTLQTPHNESSAVELIFLGTGTSSSIPHVDCLTYDPAIHQPCKTCLSTLKPEGKKNIRRNTGAVLRTKAKDGRSVYVNSFPHLVRSEELCFMPWRSRIAVWYLTCCVDDRTIVIDAGKTFQAAAVEWFPRFGLRRIDALLITHAHADGKKPDVESLCWR
jgi:phosphoribosyl 1,2-cyclic phosphodiesterase